MALKTCLALLFLLYTVNSQQILDQERSALFTYTYLSSDPVNFVTPGAIGQADIVVSDGDKFQEMFGFGACLTDSSALTMNNLKSTNPANYWSILGYAFDKTDANRGAGMTYLRVPIGASDFSANEYSLDDSSGDTSFSNFNINKIPSYVFSVIQDILSINPDLKVHLCPWSPPGWMKDSGTMSGGSLQSQYSGAYPTYLLKAVQGFESKGINVYGISIQNEPQNSNPTYPSCLMTPAVMAQIGTSLRSLLNNNGLSGVKVYGYEHNWDDAGAYPVTLMQDAPNAFNGVGFHCYAGDVSEQAEFSAAFPSKEILFTECTGTIGSDYWQDIKWYMDNIFTGSVQYGASAAMMFNFALDGNGNPKLPGTNSCGGSTGPGCRAIFQVNSDGSYVVNQEFYAIAQASKAAVPKDAGGPWGQRIGVSVGGSLDWALIVSAYETKRLSPTDYLRYSIVVLNWNDGGSSGWNPQDVQATIEFRGLQASYTFPVGVTTLFWYAPATSEEPAAPAPFTNGTTTSKNATATTTSLQFNATTVSFSAFKNSTVTATAIQVDATTVSFTGSTASSKNVTFTPALSNGTAHVNATSLLV